MNVILAYLLYVLLFTIAVWLIEGFFIVFAVISKNQTYIKFIVSAGVVIAGLYQLLATIGTFIWLLSAVGIFWAILLSLVFGTIIYGLMAGVFGFIIKLPVILLASWADERISDGRI